MRSYKLDTTRIPQIGEGFTIHDLQREFNRKLERVSCDWCNKQIEVEEGIFNGGIGTVDVSFGYPSRFDEMNFNFDICDDCFEHFFYKDV